MTLPTKHHPETGQILYAARRPRGDGQLTSSVYIWRSRDGRTVLDATADEDSLIHEYFDTDRTITGR